MSNKLLKQTVADLTEADAIRQAKNGDAGAFEHLYNVHCRRVYSLCLRMIRNPVEAEDLTQQTFLQLFRKIGTFRGEAALFTWLCTICRHEIAAHLERAPGKSVTLVEDDPAIAAALASVSADEGQEAAVARGETARLVHVVLDQLPPRYASALEWKYIDGISVQQIAERLQLSAKAAESLLTRARDAFRDAFAIVTAGEKA